ncbi:hypothetical protein SAMN05216339_104126 [Nitrosomonas eutropha]|uniref:Uncharacterized protein n=1 Tax=Nitrosomonas eutropha TaxID=916 RepID=A0A1I7H7M1_9PROT|nr:hypothetical protein [Nitrosomonas eutropha]SFU56672.1 hypothetical protein SAMN05216339_104126 [Nitrosomonas eutropha]
MDVLSLVAGFLLGVVATYLVSAFLLKPGLQKASDTATGVIITGDTKNLFDQLWQAHEHLLNEMKQDLDNPDFKFHREFYVLKKNWWDWNRWGFHREGPCLAYFTDDHNDLLPLLDALTSHGLISQIGEADKKSAKFQLSEKLIELLHGKNPTKNTA